MRRYIPRVVIMVLVAVTYLVGGLEPLEYLLMDLRFSLVERDTSRQLIFVEIDERSLRLLDVWPWPRSYHADLIDRLRESGARNIAVDVDFSSRSTPEADAKLEAALKRAEGQVILPAFKQYTGWERKVSSLAETGPLPRFAKWARLGSVVMQPETDSLVHRVSTSLYWGGQDLPSFPVLLAGGGALAPETFHIDYGIRLETLPRISYVDVLRGEFPARLFQDRDVIVGASAIELGDYLAVPRHVAVPGPALIALSAETFRQNRALRRTGEVPTLAVLALLTLLSAPFFAAWSWHRGLLVLSGGSVGLFAATVGLQKALPVSMDIVPWLVAPWLCYGQSMLALIDRQTLRIFRQRMAVLHRGAMMRRFVESSFDGIIAIDPQGKITIFNEAAEELLGYDAAEMIGKTCDDLFEFGGSNGDRDSFKISHLQSSDASVHRLREGVAHCKDGSTFVMEISIRAAELQISKNPLEQRETPRRHHFLTFRDITKRRLLEDAQRKAAEEAIAANRAKSEFMAAISHELRTPLNAIIGFSEMLKDELLGPIENEQYKSYSEEIHSSGNHLLAIINDIIDIAKIEAGTTTIEENLVDPVQVAESSISLISVRPEAKNLSISISREATTRYLLADARALKQILLNLLSNAVKFTEQGSVEVRIGTAPDGWMVIAVSDTGIGIPEDEIGNLTQPFYQVDSTLARKFEGTGLGLALSKSLMELHQGELTIESVDGQGTTVSCRFPPERVDTIAIQQNTDGDIPAGTTS